MELSTEELVKILATFLSGGGLGCLAVRGFVRTEAQKALEQDLKDFKKRFEKNEADYKITADAIHARINRVEKDYVPCKYCDSQNEHLRELFGSIDHKLEILISKK